MTKKEDRHMRILDYLQKKGTVKSSELLSEFNIRKSTLSEDLKELKSKGYPIDTSKHGYITLINGNIPLNPDTIQYNEDLSKSVLRRYLIICIINQLLNEQKEPTYNKIYEKIFKLYNDQHVVSKYMIRKDLRLLTEQEFIKQESTDINFEEKTYFPSALFPFMTEISQRDAAKSLLELRTIPDETVFLQLKERISHLYPDSYESADTDGLPDTLSMSIPQIFYILQKDYTNKSLSFNYKGKKGTHTIDNFEIGAIIYSYDKNRFYLLGRQTNKGKRKNKTQTYNLYRASDISDIKETQNSNKIFHTSYISEIINYIFEASIEEGIDPSPTEVELYFKNTEENLNRIRILTNSRNKNDNQSIASYKVYKNIDEFPIPLKKLTIDYSDGIIHYTDSVLGKKDVQKFIRGFDNEVQIIAPKDISESLKNKKSKQKEYYLTTFLKEYGENIDDCL